MNVPESAGTDWLSPTRVWRLTQCPASVGPLGSHLMVGSGGLQSSGTIAHAAVRLWIENGGYRGIAPRTELIHAIGTALAATSAAPPPAWTMTRARLLARVAQLTELLQAQPDAQVICETELRDPTLKVRGTPDVVLLGDTTTVIDLKTQTLKEDGLPPWIWFQLAIYAHLVEQAYGALPARVEVFSLNRGRIPLNITAEAVADALAAVLRARAVDPSEAHPALETCRFCTRRMECRPHWAAARFWPVSDCVEGAIKCVERASNGTVALLIETSDGPVWVSGIPANLTAALTGARIRFVRLQPTKSGDDARMGWRWGTLSMLEETSLI